MTLRRGSQDSALPAEFPKGAAARREKLLKDMGSPASKGPGYDDPSLAAPLGESVAVVPRLQYIHSYSFFFENPNWLLNLLLLTVAFLVPIVGPIVIAGYQIEIIDALHRRSGRNYPDFEFGRFGDYLSRGIWKFLVDMLSQFVMMPVYFFLYIVCIIAIVGIGAAFSQNTNNPGPTMGIAAAIVVPLAMMVAMAVLVVIQIVTTPVVLKASLSGDAGALFDVRFLADFLRRTWREMFLEMTWLLVTTPVVFLFGLLFFFIGVYPAMALVQMADAHTSWQLYEIYLARGGEPIRLKIAKPAPVIAVPIDEPQPYLASVAATDQPTNFS
jgi:hypothetical protein